MNSNASRVQRQAARAGCQVKVRVARPGVTGGITIPNAKTTP
jgi:hypothetical protein